MLVIHPDEVHRLRGLHVPECPVDAIKPGHRAGAREKWLRLNAEFVESLAGQTLR